MARIEAIILFHDSEGAGKSGSFKSIAESAGSPDGAGVDIAEVNRLVKQFEQTQKDDETVCLE